MVVEVGGVEEAEEVVGEVVVQVGLKPVRVGEMELLCNTGKCHSKDQ